MTKDKDLTAEEIAAMTPEQQDVVVAFDKEARTERLRKRTVDILLKLAAAAQNEDDVVLDRMLTTTATCVMSLVPPGGRAH